MSHDEKQLLGTIEELQTIAGKTLNPVAHVALNTVIDGLETMRPYVRVGLKVSANDGTLDSINHLYYDGMLTATQWNTLMNILRRAREGSVSQAPPVPSSEQPRAATPLLTGALAS